MRVWRLTLNIVVIVVAASALGCGGGAPAHGRAPSPAATATGSSAVKRGAIATGAAKATSPTETVTSSATATTSTCDKPQWLLQDLEVAASVTFPLQAETYELNWSTAAFANGPKIFNAVAETKRLWIGGFTGRVSEPGYRFYSGNMPIEQFYQRLQAGTALCFPITGIYMLEKSGLVPAYAINVGNGEFIAFAAGQVIAKSEHSGRDVYEVYTVKGIRLPPSS